MHDLLKTVEWEGGGKEGVGGGAALRGTRSNGGRKAARHPNAGSTVRQPVSPRKASCQCLSTACHLHSSLAADICQKVETPRSLIVTTNNASPSLCHATGQIIFFKVAKHLTLNVLPPFFWFYNVISGHLILEPDPASQSVTCRQLGY